VHDVGMAWPGAHSATGSRQLARVDCDASLRDDVAKAARKPMFSVSIIMIIWAPSPGQAGTRTESESESPPGRAVVIWHLGTP
jgi:hypothetical protein